MDFICGDIGLNGKGSCIEKDDYVYIRAGGADIWGKKDELMFYYAPVRGDFTITAALETFEQSDLYAKAGLMARATTDPQSAHVLFTAFPSNAARHKNDGGYEFQYRPTAGQNGLALYPSVSGMPPINAIVFPAWLKLERRGDLFSCYFGSDGRGWTLYCRTEVPLADELLVGMAVTAHSKKRMTLAKFTNIVIERGSEA